MRVFRERSARFWASVRQEMRQNRVSFIVYNVLRFLTLLTMARQFFMRNYEGGFLCMLTLLLIALPGMIQARFQVEIPPALEIISMCFAFAAEILGEINCFYTAIPGWDTILHTLNGFLAASVGFSLVLVLNRNERIAFELSPFFVALVAFCFSMTIGVLWEFFEFGCDRILGLDMQKDAVVPVIVSTLLQTDGTQTPIRIPDIALTAVNGVPLGIEGYLDIGLLDTMKDLLVNFVGALTFSVFGFLSMTGQTCYRRLIDSFAVRRRQSGSGDKP